MFHLMIYIYLPIVQVFPDFYINPTIIIFFINLPAVYKSSSGRAGALPWFPLENTFVSNGKKVPVEMEKPPFISTGK